MAATFVVEDGSGKSDANSYESVANADQYNLDHDVNAAWVGETDPLVKEQHLRIATAYIDLISLGRWLGYRSNELQALAWPRTDVWDPDDYLIASDAMPAVLLSATVEAAILSLGGEDLIPDLSDPGTVKSEMVKVGPITIDTDYMNGNPPIKVFRKVEDLLRTLVTKSGHVTRA